MDIEMLNNIAQLEFGMDFEQLGSNEQEWCQDTVIEYFYLI